MKKNLMLFVLSVVTVVGLARQATAAPVVQEGSSYSLYIEGDQSDNVFLATGAFDGTEKNFVRAGVNLILTENDADLGGGNNRITIDLTGDGELFTALGETAFLGVGVDGDGINLLVPVSLDDARIRLFNAAGLLLFESLNLANTANMGNPWDGFFPAPDSVIGIDGAGGVGVSRVEFDFQLSAIAVAVPEPGGLVLIGVALMALSAVRRRREDR